MLEKEIEELIHEIVKINQMIVDTGDYSNLVSLCEQDISIISIVASNKNITAKDISLVLHTPKTTIVSAVDRLTQKGYLVKEKDPNDGRRSLLNLTKLGEKANKEHLDYENKIIDFLVNCFDEDDQEILSTILARRRKVKNELL